MDYEKLSKSKNKLNKDKKNKKDDSEKYLSNNRGSNWWNKGKVEEDVDSQEEEFFEDNDSKAESIIEPGGHKVHDIPQKFGYFETEHGTVAVGYKKFHKKNELGFSIVSDDEKDSKRIPENKLNSSNTYFGNKFKGEDKRFKASKLSFQYNPQSKRMYKLSEDDDSITVDDEKELLYESDEEEKKIQKLKDNKRNIPFERKKINEKIERHKSVKEEKKDRNKKFIKEIEKFIDKFEKNKLKKILDSDEVIMAKKRIAESNEIMFLIAMIKRLLEKMTGIKGISDKMLGETFGIDIKKATKDELQKIIDKIKSRNH